MNHLHPGFKDREDAGDQLGATLNTRWWGTTVVLGLPRGGVIVADRVARILRMPLDVIVVRKLGLPQDPEIAFGAVAANRVAIMSQEDIASQRLTEAQVAEILAREWAAVATSESRYRSHFPELSLAGKGVIIVDDGIATGATVFAAVKSAYERGARTVTVAAPVASVEAVERLRSIANGCICIVTSLQPRHVGFWYDDFSQVSDERVHEVLTMARLDNPPTFGVGDLQM